MCAFCHTALGHSVFCLYKEKEEEVKRNNEKYCDKCHLIIAPKDPSQINYGNVDYYGGCYVKHRKESLSLFFC